MSVSKLADLSRSISFPSLPDLSHLQEENAKKSRSFESTNFMADLQRASLASEFVKRISTAIENFESELDSEHEVGIRLVTFGQSITFHVESVNYFNPSLIFFIGTTDEGNKVELIQHVTQISFCLIGLKKPDPNQPKRHFGFVKPQSN